MRQVNDALLVPHAYQHEIAHTYQHEIARIIAFTEDGRAVCEIFNITRVEPLPGAWKKCGHFVQRVSWFSGNWWEFFPHDCRKNAALAEVLGCIGAIANADSTVLTDTLWLNHSTTVVDSLVTAAILLDATDEQVKSAMERKNEQTPKSSNATSIC